MKFSDEYSVSKVLSNVKVTVVDVEVSVVEIAGLVIVSCLWTKLVRIATAKDAKNFDICTLEAMLSTPTNHISWLVLKNFYGIRQMELK